MSAMRQIVLVGLSGVGKSSVGAALSERLGWPLLDTDDLITEREGRTPAQLIVSGGEAAFRRIEERVVVETARRAPAVIATGGGAFLSARARRALGEQGFLCHLDATPQVIAERLREAPGASDRPLLGADIERRLLELEEERRPYYQHADAWIPVQASTPDEAASRILVLWSERSGAALADERRRGAPGGRGRRRGRGRPSSTPSASATRCGSGRGSSSGSRTASACSGSAGACS